MSYAVISLASLLQEKASAFILSELVRRGITDLAPCHGDILARLYAGSDGCTISELAERTHRTKSTVSVLVSRLSASGYVEKLPARKDSRAVQILLTEKGRSLRPVFEEISDTMNAKLLSGFKAFEAQALEDLLLRCTENFA